MCPRAAEPPTGTLGDSLFFEWSSAAPSQVPTGALLVDAAVTEPDSLVDVLLAPLAAENFAHQRARGLSVEQITRGLSRLAHAVLD